MLLPPPTSSKENKMSNRHRTIVTASAILCLCFVLIAFSGFTQHSKLSPLSSRRFLEDSSDELLIKLTSNLQLWLITHPNIPFGSTLLSVIYAIDLWVYNAGAKDFLTARQELLGKNLLRLDEFGLLITLRL